MPSHNSHTHCQAAPANATTQAWQRVCLSYRTTKTTDKPADEKNTEAITAVLQKWRFSASYDSEVVNQNLMLRMKFSGENRHLRKAAKRYVGSDGYLAWLDHVLQIRDTANTDLNDVGYEFGVCHSAGRSERFQKIWH